MLISESATVGDFEILQTKSESFDKPKPIMGMIKMGKPAIKPIK